MSIESSNVEQSIVSLEGIEKHSKKMTKTPKENESNEGRC